jgi:hypothetical protein
VRKCVWEKDAPLSMESGRFIRNGLARENHGEHHFFSKQPIAGFSFPGMIQIYPTIFIGFT